MPGQDYKLPAGDPGVIKHHLQGKVSSMWSQLTR